ncbi:GNAT family N-acetyltransferase [Bacillus safensis]|uniref:GNAT family N-acetyltransferase n=1 Tax=Bacillus safensis TaxID=561879 RepID=UPI0013CF698F|nr:GNAT family protein [Bacillus safensis]
MNLTTERCIIRSFAEDDWQDVYAYTSNETVMKYIPEDVFSKEDAKEFVKNNRHEGAKYVAVLLKEDHTYIGHIAFHPYFGEHTYEIGWVFNPAYQNKGYASEAAYAVLHHGFHTLNLHRIIATCQPENVPSWRVMEKLGMRREGYFKQCIPQGNEWWDEFYYALLQEKWFEKRA